MAFYGSIIAQCSECCDCPAPTIEWDSRSASLSKCGFSFSDIPNASAYHNRRYLRRTLSGGYTDERSPSGPCAPASASVIEETQEGDSEYVACVFDAGTATRHRTGNPDCTIGSSGVGFPYRAGGSGCAVFFYIARISDIVVTDLGGGSIQANYSDSFCDGVDFITYTNMRSVLSDEYTTAALITNVIASLPAYDGDWNDTAGSMASLTANELTYSIREGKYRFRFKIPKVGLGTCYRLEWVERFTPTSGSPVDTPKSWDWDGTIPPGYNPATPSTYPLSSEFTVAIPATNGTTTVVDVVAFCTGCA